MSTVVTWLGIIYAKIVDVSENTAKAVGGMLYEWRRQYGKKTPQWPGLLPTTSTTAFRCIVIQKFPRDLNGKTWLKCRLIIGPGNIYDTDPDPAKDVIVYGGIDPWFTCGDEIVALAIAAVDQGEEPYPSNLYAYMNPPVDQPTLLEPEVSCIVASPVPCVAEPPDPDPCLPAPPQ